MNINKSLYTLIFLFFLTNICFSQITDGEIDRATFLLTGTLTDKDGKSKSYNKSFQSSPSVKYVERNGAQSLSGSYSPLENYNLNFTSSLKTADKVVQRRVSKSKSRDIINTYFNNLPNELKILLSTSGRVVLKGNATASINIRLQLGNRNLGFKQKNIRYDFKLKEGDSSRIQIFDKNKILVSTIQNGGYFWFSHQDSAYRTFVGQNEAVFTTDTTVETKPLEDLESFAFLKSESVYDLVK